MEGKKKFGGSGVAWRAVWAVWAFGVCLLPMAAGAQTVGQTPDEVTPSPAASEPYDWMGVTQPQLVDPFSEPLAGAPNPTALMPGEDAHLDLSPKAAPLPPAVWAGLALLSGSGVVRYIKRRRLLAR